VDLRAKLERFRKPAKPAMELPEPPPEGTGRPEIEALRARLAEVMARSAAREVDKRAVRQAEIEARLAAAPLPFDTVELDSGTLHVRTVRHPSHERVGRVPVLAARKAKGELLALLSLDPTLAHVDAAGALYLDTEATGLAGGTGTVPFLIGLGWFEEDEFVVEQLLLRRLGEEAPMLERLASRILRATMLVSFNGKAFDMPLLRTRFVMNRMPNPLEPAHLDLVHVARRVHRGVRGRGDSARPITPEGVHRGGPWIESVDEAGDALRRTSCKLVALERQILGFGRVDDVPSSEVPARYGHFIRTGDADAIRSVCDHNLWDVVSMAALVTAYAGAIEALDDNGEPEVALGGRDLVGLATTLERAGDLRRARRAADAAVDASLASTGDTGTTEVNDDELHALARRARGGIAVRTRDVDTALGDYEHLSLALDDAKARLSLAKLYEHRLKDPGRALENVARGVAEKPEQAEHRRARLERKTAQLAVAPSRSPRGKKTKKA